MNIKQLVAYKISDARNYLGLKQQDLADKLGVGKNTVSQWERGVRGVSIEVLEQIAQATNKPIWWFFQAPESNGSKIADQKKVKDTTKGGFETTLPADTMAKGDRSSRKIELEDMRQKMEANTNQFTQLIDALNRVAATQEALAKSQENLAKGQEKLIESQRAQDALLADILKGAKQNADRIEDLVRLETAEIQAEGLKRNKEKRK